MEIPRERLTLVITAAIAAVALGLYLFLYRPVLKELRATRTKYAAMNPELERAQKLAEMLKPIETDRRLISEKDISIAIDELTRLGNAKGINFISMRPGAAEERKDAPYKIMPITIEIESTYEELGIFLGALDDLERSLITIDEFNIISQSDDPVKLKTLLEVHMYIAER